MTLSSAIDFIFLFVILICAFYFIGLICYEKGKHDGEMRGLQWVELAISMKRKTRKTVDSQQGNIAQN